MLTICFSNTINLLEPDIYPADSISLAKGFFETSGMKEITNISKCEPEFNEFVFKLAITLDQMLDNKNSLTTFGTLLIDLSNLKNKCYDSEFGRSEIAEYFHNAIRNPQKFILAVLDNMLSFFVAGKYLELKGNLKENRMYETGKTLGDIAKHVMNIKLKDSSLFLNESIDCQHHYLNFIGTVYNMIQDEKASMNKLLKSTSNLINECK
jgi:hypothetical protein